MWIVFGSKVKTTRVPGGARVERHCGQCGETATFYEKEVTSTFRLYFLDVFDYQRHRVMACGCCGACYATDELGLPATGKTEEMDEGPSVVGYLNRAADAVESGIGNLFPSTRPTRVSNREEREWAEPKARPPEEDELDPLEDPIEARFRELERKAGLRGKNE